MNCTQCGAANREGARFCSDCGAALALRCASCGSELRATAKFCDECGTPTGAAPSAPAAVATPNAAVRKTVTVVFCDLGGSTSFGERTDAELAREVMARYHAILQATVDAHGGTVAKFMGDGMMATFGIPEVAEDDAIRAVRAGVDLQREFTDFAAGVDARHGETLTLRVGVNTGEVVIAAGDADLIGDALNVAARLEKACRPGNVLVGEETWRLTRSQFGYESLGEVTVAGRAQPVPVFEVAAGGSTTIEPASPFVGRGAEMQRLRAVFDGAVSERSAQLVAVLGSPGVGKTRLSRELCAAVEADANAITFEVRCDRAGDATFAPIAQLIREATDLGDDADAPLATTRVAALLAEDEPDRDRLVTILAGLVGAAPSRSVEETFWAIRRLVAAVAATRPMLVVIDDIQWAEPLLLDLLEHLAEWVQDVPLVLLCLARPELREVRPSLAERGRGVEDVVALDGLDSTATEQLAAGLLGTDHLPAGLVARLPTSTDGNPLFVRELVRMLVDDQVIRRRDGEWELAIDADAVEVPPTIQSLLAARVERLPADERTVLELASVIGAEFSLGALRELAGEDRPLPDLLEVMRRKELVEPTGTYWGDEPVHRFHHVLIRDSAYRRLLKTTRADLHERVAVWTDQVAAGLIGEHEAVVAYHYEQAFQYRNELGSVGEHVDGLGRRAAELLSAAADRALGRDDLAAAGALARRALELLPDIDTDTDATARAALLLTACECLLSSGDVATARPVVEQLRAAAGSDAALGAWAASFEAQLIGLTDPEALVAAEAAATVAATAMQELGDGAGEAKAHQVRAALLARLGRVGDAEVELELALDAARGVDDRRRVTAVLGAAPVAALWGPSPVARAGGRCLDVVRLLRITTASPSVEATSMRCQAVLEALRGRFDVSRSMLASSRATLEELGLRHGLLETEYLAGVVELIADDPAAAIEPLRSAYRGLGEMGVGVDAGRAAALLARALLAEGQLEGAEPMAAASESLAGQDLKTAIAWRVAKAEVLAARGDAAAGVSLAEEAVAIASGTDLVIDHADACVALAGLRSAAGDALGALSARADAARLYEAKGATVPAARLAGREATPPNLASPAPRVSDGEASTSGTAHRSRTDRAENTATRQTIRYSELVSVGQIDEATDLLAADYADVDHRTTVAGPPMDREGFTASMRVMVDLGLTPTCRPIAARGDRLALMDVVLDTDGGDELPMLGLIALDTDALITSVAWFDHGDVASALNELDERYIAGEGAEHADIVRAMREFRQSFSEWDFVRQRDTMAEDLVMVDRREFGWPALDRDGYIEMQRGYGEALSSSPLVLVTRTFHVVGRAGFVTAQNRAVGRDGVAYEWVFHAVAVYNAERLITRLELFAEDDFASALARLDELGSGDPRHSRAENAATRQVKRFAALVTGDDLVEAGALVADDLLMVDNRSMFATTRLRGRAEFMANMRAMLDLGLSDWTIEPLAVRGDRLQLSRFSFSTPDSSEVVTLGITEIRPDGLGSYSAFFDEDALGPAQDELDERYLAGAGAEHADLVRMAGEFRQATVSWDAGRLRAAMADDLSLVDHRELSWPVLDREGYLELSRGYAETLASGRFDQVMRSFHFAGRAILITIHNHAVTGDGTDDEWTFHGVGLRNEAGRISRMEMFPEEDFDRALACLDELGASEAGLQGRHPAGEGAPGAHELGVGDPRHPRAENAAVRVISEVNDLVGPWDESQHLFADDIRLDDRRRVIGMPATGQRDEVMASQRVSTELGLGHATSAVTLAVRGDRLSLHLAAARVDGYEFGYLVVVEINEDQQLAAIVVFDDDDFDDALDELDRRALAGVSADEAEVLEVGVAFVRCANTTDWEGLRALLADQFLFTDQRQLSWPGLDRENFVGMQQSYGDAVQQRLIPRSVQVAGRAILSTFDSIGLDAEGGEFRWSFHVVSTIDSSRRIERMATFAENDYTAALAHFDERAIADAGDRTAAIDNEAVRTMTRLATLGTSDLAAAIELLALDARAAEHRGGPLHAASAGTRAELVDILASMADTFDEITFEPLAVRGERTALLRFAMTADGFVSAGLLVAVIDERHLVCRLEAFEDSDIRLATETLDECSRQVAGESAAPREELENLATQFAQRVAEEFAGRRDFARLSAEWVTDDAVRWDHRGGVAAPPARGRAEFAEAVNSASASFGALRVETIAVRGSRLALQRTTQTSPDGFEITFLVAFEVDEHGRLLVGHYFDESDLEAVLDQLDDQYLAGEGAEHSYIVRRLQDTARARRKRDVKALDGLCEGDFAVVDHRRIGYGIPDADAMPIAQQARLDQTIGDRPLHRWRLINGDVVFAELDTIGTTPEGNEYRWSFLVIWQLAGGRWARLELFDLDDYDTAHTRFEELAADTPTQRVDNDAVRAFTRMAWLGTFDLASAVELLADVVHGADHRSGPLHAASADTREQWIDVLTAIADVFETIAFVPIAVRGQRLALLRFTMAASGFESTGLLVVEIDIGDRVCLLESFDESDLHAAVESLEVRHREIAGDSLSLPESSTLESMSAINRRDWAALDAKLAPDFVTLDHTPFGFAPGGRVEFVEEQMQSLVALVPDVVAIAAKLYTTDRAAIFVTHASGTTVDGNRYEWANVCVSLCDADGRGLRNEFFGDDRWAEALAHFDRWASEPPATPSGVTLANDVTRGIERIFEMGATGTFDLTGIVSDDIVRFDRRHRGVSTPTLNGKAEFEDNLRAIYDVFDTGGIEPIALRGERAALMRVSLSRDGFAASMLGVYDADETGLLRRGTSFDEADLASAVAELEARYLTGEGSAHEPVVSYSAELWRRYNTRDWDGVRALIGDDFQMIDHRPVSAGTVRGPEHLIDYMKGMVDLAPDAYVLRTHVLAVGLRCIVDAIFSWGSTPDGTYVEFEYLSMGVIENGICISSELFAPDQADAALARFHEIEADQSS